MAKKQTNIIDAAQPTKQLKPVKKAAPRVQAAKHRAAPAEAIAGTSTEISLTLPSESIALLAYSYWESRGCQGGDQLEDWLRAEKELQRRAL